MAVIIPIVTEFAPKGIRRAIKEFKQLEGAGAKAGFLLRKAFQSIAYGAVALGAAIAGAAVAAFNFAKAAAEDQTSQALLAKQLRTTTKATNEQIRSVEDWIGQLQLANGIADSELRPNLAKLVRATGRVSKAQELLGLALDVSAGSGRDLDGVVTALVRAYNGNLGGLSRLGLSLDKSTIKSKDFTKAQEELQKQFGGAAQTRASTFQGTMARLGEAFSELKEAAGYVLLEPLQKLANIGIAMVDAFGQRGAAGALEELKKGFDTLFWNDQGQLNQAGMALNKLIDLLNKLAAAGIIAASAAGGAAIGNLVPGIGPIIGGVSAGVAGFAYTKLVDTRLAQPLGEFNAQRFQQGLLASTVGGPGGGGPAFGGTGMAGPVTVNVYNGDPNEVVRAIQKYQRRNGQLVGRIANLGS